MIGYLYKLYLEERKTRLGKTMINKEISASTWRCLVTSMVCTTFMFLLCSNIIMDGSFFFMIHHNHKVTLSDIDALEIVSVQEENTDTGSWTSLRQHQDLVEIYIHLFLHDYRYG